MKFNFKRNKILAYNHLMRMNKPVGILLLLWPTLWALWIATSGLPSLQITLKFITGVWLIRTAGCILNDYIDCKFDGYVKRTFQRPLPSGAISRKEALILFIILIIMSSFLALSLNIKAILFSIIALILILIYPFMKRYTYFPQVVLGVAFSWSIPIVFTAVNNSTSLSCWLMFLANTLWTIAYDTQYAMIDRDDDIKIGIKSTAVLFGYNDRLIIGILQAVTLILISIIGYLNAFKLSFYWKILIAGSFFIYQQKLIVNRNYKSCYKAFISNNYVGLVIFLAFITSF